MSTDTWIVVGGQPGIANLVEAARSLDASVTAAVVGPRSLADSVAASGVDRVVWFGEDREAPVEAYATSVAAEVAAAEPRVLLGGRHPAERVLLGAVAASLRAVVLTGAQSVSIEGADVVVVQAVFGGIAEQTVAVTGPLALVLDGGAVPPLCDPVPVEEVDAAPMAMTVIENRPSEFEVIDLAAAPRVVCVGRGLKAEKDLTLIESLAGAAKAEVACSRPLAEGLSWLGKDRYVGSSGQHIAPELYIAVGISGQLQHMAGVRDAVTIVAINSDPEAPIFAEADYGLVGDLYTLVPAITDALS